MQEKTKAKCEAPTPSITTLFSYSFHTINRYRERVERQFKIVKPDATAAELKDVVDGDFQDIFAKHLMTNQHKAAQQAIADINDKHQVCALPPFCIASSQLITIQDIVKLERSITELHQVSVYASRARSMC